MILGPAFQKKRPNWGFFAAQDLYSTVHKLLNLYVAAMVNVARCQGKGSPKHFLFAGARRLSYIQF